MSKPNENGATLVQQSLLPTVSVDSICAQELMKRMKAQAQALEVCGEYMLRQQAKIDQLSENVEALVELLTAHVEKRDPNRPTKLTPPVNGHVGYSVKEFAALLGRSPTYVYRLLYNNEIEANRAGRITHESYIKMQTKTSALQKRRRERKWQ